MRTFNIEQTDIPPQTQRGTTALMWMHITWLPFIPLPLHTYIIWRYLKNKHPQANAHGKNILNALLTFLLIHFVSLFSFIGIGLALITFGFVEGEIYWTPTSVHFHYQSVVLSLFFITWFLCLFIGAITSTITVGLAARRGKVFPYWWAIRFFKTKESKEPQV